MNNNQKKLRAFTLIELLLVMAIIAILSALGVSVLANAEQDALEKRTQAGIERISKVLNDKLEANTYRVLPYRLPAGATPVEVKTFREQVMAELLQVEFPFRYDQVDFTTPYNPTMSLFPENTGTIPTPSLISQYVFQTDVPQIPLRYEAKLGSAFTTDHESAELLYAILSLNYDEFGQPLSAVLREREIGDVDNDGNKEVLDAFGDPLLFSIRARLDQDDLIAIAPADINRTETADAAGYEVVLDQTRPLNAGQVRGPRPIEDYRIRIVSGNLKVTSHDAVVTQ